MCMFLLRLLLKLIRAYSSSRRAVFLPRCPRAFDSHVKQHAITSSQVTRPDDQKMHFTRNVIWIIQSHVASACNMKRAELRQVTITVIWNVAERQNEKKIGNLHKGVSDFVSVYIYFLFKCIILTRYWQLLAVVCTAWWTWRQSVGLV